MEEFQGLEDFKEELLGSSHLTYLTRYSDSRDAVGRVYLDLGLSHVAVPDFEKEGTDVGQELGEDAPIEEALTEEAPTEEAPNE